MQNRTALPLLSLLGILMFGSCQDFIEVNLGKKNMTILSPANNTVSPNFNQIFWWEELKGADQYQIQIVKPAFSSIAEFITDTTVTTTKFLYTLHPGTYQWRIRAKNSSSATDFITYNLTIDSTLDLSGQHVILSSPADNYFTHSFSNTFIWQNMPNADSYIFQVLSGGSVISTQTSISLNSNYTFASEGIYQWRVFAQNSTSNSAYITRTITVDTTRPNIPVISFPIMDTITANPIPLTWNTVETGDSYRVQVSTDSTFTSVLKDTTTSNTVYDLINANVGQYYYWRVRAIDQALNQSNFSYRKRIKRN
jgi:hypothetical protein